MDMISELQEFGDLACLPRDAPIHLPTLGSRLHLHFCFLQNRKRCPFSQVDVAHGQPGCLPSVIFQLYLPLFYVPYAVKNLQNWMWQLCLVKLLTYVPLFRRLQKGYNTSHLT